ncbi:cell division FtsK/SpoIIIE protein [Tetragenococcus muriaticus PMC-11-5]|uniref:Cell division FtsK/SpoIIIE protein n=1 Tax=Tetragenococcus muriaticus PMC-11-5 TaxID=1302649 RepID=A0A091BZC3_9ENTE|nr:cell division FtsK/SpoIIIE protein [Tetragenococcus muriaticus PMC-11-5]
MRQQEKLTLISFGFLFILFAIFALFQLGFLGTLIANGFRIIGGNTYPVLCVLLAVYGLWVMIKNNEAKTKITYGGKLAGALLIYLGVLIFFHAQLFGRIQTDQPQILATTWQILLSDIQGAQVSANVGGGMVGALLYQTTFFLVSKIGSYVFAVLFIILGGYFISPMDSQQLLELLHGIKEKIQKLIAGNPEKKAQKQENKEARKQARKEKKEQKQAQEREAALQQVKEQEKNQVRSLSAAEKLSSRAKS